MLSKCSNKNRNVTERMPFASRNFGVKCKKCENWPRARHNFSQIYANSLVDVGQPVERLSPRLICRATSPIYASRACSKLAGVFTARRFTGTPGVKTIPERLSDTGQDDPLCTHLPTPPHPRHSARKYDIW